MSEHRELMDDLMDELMKPYKSAVEESDASGDAMCYFLWSEGEVVLTLSIEGDWLYVSISDNDYRERGESNEPESTDLFDESWELSKPDTIAGFHKALGEFIDNFYKEVAINLGERLSHYNTIIEERKACANQ